MSKKKNIKGGAFLSAPYTEESGRTIQMFKIQEDRELRSETVKTILVKYNNPETYQPQNQDRYFLQEIHEAYYFLNEYSTQHTLTAELKQTIEEALTNMKRVINITTDSTNIVSFFGTARSPLIDRIKTNNFLLQLIWNGEAINETPTTLDKLLNLKREAQVFCLKVKFYNWKFSNLSKSIMGNLDKIRALLEIDEKKKEVGALDFTIPFKDEAIQILLFVSVAILKKYNFIKIEGGITVDDKDNNVILLFVNKEDVIPLTIRETPNKTRKISTGRSSASRSKRASAVSRSKRASAVSRSKSASGAGISGSGVSRSTSAG